MNIIQFQTWTETCFSSFSSFSVIPALILNFNAILVQVLNQLILISITSTSCLEPHMHTLEWRYNYMLGCWYAPLVGCPKVIGQQDVCVLGCLNDHVLLCSHTLLITCSRVFALMITCSCVYLLWWLCLNPKVIGW